MDNNLNTIKNQLTNLPKTTTIKKKYKIEEIQKIYNVLEKFLDKQNNVKIKC